MLLERSSGHLAKTCQSFFGGLISSPVCNDTTAKLPTKTAATKKRKAAVRLLISSCPSMKAKEDVIKSKSSF